MYRTLLSKVNCGAAPLRCGVIVLSSANGLCGLALLAAGATTSILFFGMQNYIQKKAVVTAPMLTLMILGFLMFVNSFYGCYGVIKHNKCTLATFAISTLFLLTVQIAASVVTYVNTQCGWEQHLTESLKPSFQKYGEGNVSINSRVDETQRMFECCGLMGPHYWREQNKPIPESCCENNKCENVRTEGCVQKIMTVIQLIGLILGGTTFAATFITIAGVVSALCLASYIPSRRWDNERNEKMRSEDETVEPNR